MLPAPTSKEFKGYNLNCRGKMVRWEELYSKKVGIPNMAKNHMGVDNHTEIKVNFAFEV